MAVVGAVLIVLTLFRDSIPLVSLVRGSKPEVRIEQLPSFTHKSGIITLAAGKVKRSLANPLVKVKGQCTVDTAIAYDKYGERLTLVVSENEIRLDETLGPNDLISIAYSLKQPAKVDDITVEAGGEIWSFQSQREDGKRNAQVFLTIPWIILTLIILYRGFRLLKRICYQRVIDEILPMLKYADITREVSRLSDVLLSKYPEMKGINEKENFVILLKKLIDSLEAKFGDNQKW